MHNLKKACPNGYLTGILVAPKYFQLFHRNQHEASLSSCLLYQIKQLPPPKKSFSTRKFFFKSRRFVWVSLFFMQNAASSCVNKIFTNRENFWSEIHCPCVRSKTKISLEKQYIFQAQDYNLYRFKKRPFTLNCRWAKNRGFWIDQMPLHFDRRGPRRQINTMGVIQGTTPPTSLIYFFMQITIKAISSSENKKHRPQSRAQFIRVISVTGGHLQSFFHFFHMTPIFTWLQWETYDGRASPDRGSDGERHWHAGESVTWWARAETVTSVITRLSLVSQSHDFRTVTETETWTLHLSETVK